MRESTQYEYGYLMAIQRLQELRATEQQSILTMRPGIFFDSSKTLIRNLDFAIKYLEKYGPEDMSKKETKK